LEIFSLLQSATAVKDTESLYYKNLIQQYEHAVKIICEDHINAAQIYVRDPSLKATLSAEIRNECKEISDYRAAAERWHLEIDSRSKDRLISFGEKLSCCFMTAVLRDRVCEIQQIEFYFLKFTFSGR
jgi:aspartate kinase